MTLTDADLAAHAALKARQGGGARYDADNAPAEDLLLARRGTAFLARKLMELPDAALYEASAVAGWSRAHVVARVSYGARLQAWALEALSRDTGEEMPEGMAEGIPPLGLAATLPARALRHLFEHSQVHLNVCWRDLGSADWDRSVVLADGAVCPARALPMRRARQIWQAALDLGAGVRRTDLPGSMRAGLQAPAGGGYGSDRGGRDLYGADDQRLPRSISAQREAAT